MISVSVKPGTYVVAVSGGVDSMVLLDLLRRISGLNLVVAHVDHGIREDSQQDRKLVQRIAMSHNLTYEYKVLSLGAGVSEEHARDERYKFLRHICKKYNATAIITAHHQDDLLETAIINLIRGTGWRGLCSMRSAGQIIRPLLAVQKQQLLDYARQHRLEWREDSTNQDPRYLRNYVRLNVIPRMEPRKLDLLLQIIVRQNELADQIDAEAVTWLKNHATFGDPGIALPRYGLIMQPPVAARELLQQALRSVGAGSVERPLLGRLLLFCKVAKSGKIFQLNRDWQVRATSRQVIVERRPSVVS